MAAPYTDAATLTNLVTAAYDRQVRLSLRSVPMFRSIATVKAVDQTAPGNSVAFLIHGDLATAISPLTEAGVVDPTGAALSNPTKVTVTLNEYGNFTVVSKALREFALDNNIDGNIANVIAYNLANSVDTVIKNILIGTDNNITSQIVTSGGAYVKPVKRTYAELITKATGGSYLESASNSLSTLTAKDVRWVVAQLRATNVPTVDGQNYVAFIHPTVAADFRAETSTAGASAIWAAPHVYNETSNLYAGEIGTFEGVRFIETPRVPALGDVVVAYKGGVAQTSLTQTAYTTFIVGADALAEAVAEEFHVVADGVVVDPLKRKMALGWYGIAGWELFRPASLWAIKSVTANA